MDFRNLRITEPGTFLVDSGSGGNCVDVKGYMDQGIAGPAEGWDVSGARAVRGVVATGRPA